ncbi:histidine phosphatase family protein [Streptomyces sp. AV19]|uniref:histidine phosphatase family protein n=1 Tax=Streptomyces sp. AV19 TaxID=2793068 RepID=UPI0018FE7651|nr:histidine phosphatase family protein [Streptomyces sp. AV19]MBH1935927.1 histidine phosphatase family protein [Streptomyces sp. AV19]MDG4534290.1 histidine phosphatase family protein [Streptomyces sp. AV19]
MPPRSTRYLYLARHGEATQDGSALTENGRRQAALLGERLRPVPFPVVHHSPLGRAAETARLVAEQLGGVPTETAEEAGDGIPYVPCRAELPAEHADFLLAYIARFPAEAREKGPLQARRALKRFTGPVDGPEDRHELVITHNFLVGWLTRAALDAPDWRWLMLNQGNAALTVIRYAPDRPASLLVHNDVRHLPKELRWTGFPPELHV